MAKTSTKSKQATSKKVEVKTEDRPALNDKARYDYGIMNADQMEEKQLRAEMKAIDDQAKVGETEKENA